MNESNHSSSLPSQPELFRLRKEAKLLLKSLRSGDADAIAQANLHYRDIDLENIRLCDAQLVLARTYGFKSWPRLAAHVLAHQPSSEPDPLRYEDVFRVVKAGDTKRFLSMLETDETILDIADSRECTPLTVSFAYQHIDLAQVLIEHGANVFAMNHSQGAKHASEIDGEK